MSPLLNANQIPALGWHEIELTLQAHTKPHRAHPLVVIEALFKGVFEHAGLHPERIKQIWNSPQHNLVERGWENGERLNFKIQLFGLQAKQHPDWLDALHTRFARDSGQNFDLIEVGELCSVQAPPLVQLQPADAFTLDFLTPIPLPHQLGQSKTALNGEGFIRLCQTRLRKLFAQEGNLPAPPELDTRHWRYWRTVHRSKSQQGNPMYIHGCLGSLNLSGSTLQEWQPWLALFSAIGLGERLSFGQGRFNLSTAQPESAQLAPAPLKLRRPFLLDIAQSGAKLALDNANLVVTHHQHAEAVRIPLMRLSQIELHAQCQISSALIEACAEQDIPLLLASPGKAPLVVTGYAAEARRNRIMGTHHARWNALTLKQRVHLAAQLIESKLAHCELIVRQRYQAGDNQLLYQLTRARARIQQSESIAVVRGWEGWAARQYYSWLGTHAMNLGAWQRRQQHGQIQDPINILLNYSYALLRHRLGVEIRSAGLDPYLGILHEPNGRHDALVSDLMEPWRPYIDRLVLRLIRLKIIQQESFVQDDGILKMQPLARKRIVQAFVQMLEGTPKHGGQALLGRIKNSVANYRQAILTDRFAEWRTDGDQETENAETD